MHGDLHLLWYIHVRVEEGMYVHVQYDIVRLRICTYMYSMHMRLHPGIVYLIMKASREMHSQNYVCMYVCTYVYIQEVLC